MSEKKTRKLAAILFADIVGYTSLMQTNEAHTFQIIKRYQTILDSAAQQFNGQVLKNYGDGSLMTFSNNTNDISPRNVICLFRDEKCHVFLKEVAAGQVNESGLNKTVTTK